MAHFESDAEVYDQLGGILNKLVYNSARREQLRQADAVVQFAFREPDATVTLDVRAHKTPRIELGATKLRADVVLAMDADTGRALLTGELSPTIALARGDVRTKGPVAKVRHLKLLVEHGVDVRAPFADGRTPAARALRNGDPELVDYLVTHGAESPSADPVDALLGAFIAGMVVGISDGDERPNQERYWGKLRAIGYGFLVPVFFVMTGVQFNVRALLAHASSLALVPLLVLAIAVVRGGPALLYRRRLGTTPAVAAGLLQATTLTFPVVVAALGSALGLLSPASAAALIGASLLSVLLFPAAALALRPWTRAPAPERDESVVKL